MNFTTPLRESKGEGSNDNKIESDDKYKLGGSEIDGGKLGDDEIGKKDQKTSKSKKSSLSKKTMGFLDFLTSEARLVFIKLGRVFDKALILYYFDLKYYI